jgi:voltage-gated potassium channel
MEWTRVVALIVVSPTRLAIELWKEGREDAGPLLQHWNFGWFWFEIAVCIVLAAYSLTASMLLPAYVRAALACIAIWRCNEVVWAFYNDAMDQLQGKPAATSLTAAQRIPMAMRSYWGLTANFAFIVYALPCLYKPAPADFIQALYFSGVTIATLGYGDITPIHPISRMLAVYEVFAGILLVVLALGIYLAGFNKREQPDRPRNDAP